jgi:Holliday junction resolvase-like predicted endonuclease
MATIMQYSQFKQIFNETIFEKSKADLLEKIANDISNWNSVLLSPTISKAKVLQNLLQSHEIRFGDAFEHVIEKYLELKGCEILQKKYTLEDGSVLNIDQCFRKGNAVYFIEQKVRDDHDSTKKRGQIDNFEKKLDLMLSKFPENKLAGIFYFIDPDLVKNKNFYTVELDKMRTDYGVETQIFYGKPLFDYLGYPDIWEEILYYLKRWREEIPDLPEINFDLDAQHTFDEVKDIKPLFFRKLLENEEIFNEIVLTLFPQKTTLNLLLAYFGTKSETIYRNIAIKLRSKL